MKKKGRRIRPFTMVFSRGTEEIVENGEPYFEIVSPGRVKRVSRPEAMKILKKWRSAW